jgi:hypothetical protein
MPSKKPRSHNEWFRPVARKSRCPSCNRSVPLDETLWSWGEYVSGKWRTVKHFCRECYVEEVQTPLISHTADCGCSVELRFKGIIPNAVPDWLTLPEPSACES